jgi:hypothetical protein
MPTIAESKLWPPLLDYSRMYLKRRFMLTTLLESLGPKRPGEGLGFTVSAERPDEPNR